MDIKIGDYAIESDSMQFVVKRKSIVKEGVFTKAENIGNETFKPVAYCVEFEQALKYIPNDMIKTNEEVNTLMDKLNAIQEDIQEVKEYPVIFIKEENEITIKKEIEKEEVE